MGNSFSYANQLKPRIMIRRNETMDDKPINRLTNKEEILRKYQKMNKLS